MRRVGRSELVTESGKDQVMATTDYKHGSYSIAALSSQTFTFWWGRDSKAPNEYFDVFVSPEFDPKHTGMSPLIEEQRAISHDTSEGAGRIILFLTLRNNNNFPIKFVANHVRIY
jgi:hypothetical protein